MRGSRLLALALIVAGLGAFIWFWERHQPTTEEVQKQAELVLPGLEKGKVTRIGIVHGKDRFELVRKGHDWYLAKPIEARADDQAVDLLLSALTSLKAERRLDAGEVSLKDWGLDDPEFTVTLSTSAGTSRTLRVGIEEPLGNNRAVTLDGTSVLLCSKWFVSDLDKGLDGWRSHQVVKLFEDEVASLEIDTGKDRIQAVRDGRLWRLLEPVRDLADRDQIRNVISAFNGLRIKAFVDDAKPDLEALGLEKPRYRVKIVRSAGKAPVTLEFGAKRELEGVRQVACRRDGKDLFWVTDGAETPLGKAPVLWRSKVVYPFDTWDVDRCVIDAGGAKAELDHEGSTWKCSGHEADSSKVFDRLSSLARLEAESFDLVKPRTAEIGSITLTLKPAPGAGKDAKPETVTWTFYEPMKQGGRALVTVSGRDTIMSADAAKVRGLVKDPAGLCKPPATPTPVPETGKEKPPAGKQ